MTRAKLEGLVEDLVQRSMDCTERCRSFNLSDILITILVGGQTRMPMVSTKSTEFLGREPRKDVNPDEAVAIGAAIQVPYCLVTKLTCCFLT